METFCKPEVVTLLPTDKYLLEKNLRKLVYSLRIPPVVECSLNQRWKNEIPQRVCEYFNELIAYCFSQNLIFGRKEKFALILEKVEFSLRFRY